jgi:signal transduction histidine kinase
MERLSLARQFLLGSLVVSLLGALAVGVWVGQQIENGVVARTGAIAALYVDSVVARPLQPLAERGSLTPTEIATLDQLNRDTALGERVVAFKVWSPDGRILYSTNPLLIGRQYPTDAGLARALQGGVAADLSDLDEEENEFERPRFARLLEVYAPVRDWRTGDVFAVAEFYQPPDELERDVAAARRRSWAVVGGTAILTYLVLGGIVTRGSNTIVRQQAALRSQVGALQELLEQNAGLRARVQHAAGRTTALNEQALRRIGSDLHDGPGQALALALLRLDELGNADGRPSGEIRRDYDTVQTAVRDALTEIREISSGLRLPELAPLSVAEVAERAVRDHRRRSGTTIQLDAERVPAQAPLPIKIALVRTLQEALSNATRHGRGAEVTAAVWSEDGELRLRVSDRGPGFDPVAVGEAGGLGLAGMRERAQMLGGGFRLEAVPGQGTTVEARWPLGEARAA